MIFRLLLVAVCLLAGVTAFSPSASMAPLRSNNQRGGQLTMGNNAAFGIFSPAVYAAKFVLGEQKLNKVSKWIHTLPQHTYLFSREYMYKTT